MYEFKIANDSVMRRRADDWINATHILKAAGFDKPARTRILEREVQKGVHEKVQGGYGKYQGSCCAHSGPSSCLLIRSTRNMDTPPRRPRASGTQQYPEQTHCHLRLRAGRSQPPTRSKAFICAIQTESTEKISRQSRRCKIRGRLQCCSASTKHGPANPPA